MAALQVWSVGPTAVGSFTGNSWPCWRQSSSSSFVLSNEIGQTKIINGSAPDIAGKVSLSNLFFGRPRRDGYISTIVFGALVFPKKWCSVAKLLTTSSLPEMSCSWVEKLAVIPYPDFIYDSRFTINKYRSRDMLS
ncbi:HXXXD-type acyl-transferase family protein [Striga asiatica]|uniref:HXXXD-type acyl-transferase family protein n=1 Tax=Striga asiatica TaxID=4170 RepID=A0A5A7PI40_STRAF|nr:HXXXD-type acyl-transferase family protein [Striga asiatica]